MGFASEGQGCPRHGGRAPGSSADAVSRGMGGRHRLDVTLRLRARHDQIGIATFNVESLLRRFTADRTTSAPAPGSRTRRSASTIRVRRPRGALIERALVSISLTTSANLTAQAIRDYRRVLSPGGRRARLLRWFRRYLRRALDETLRALRPARRPAQHPTLAVASRRSCC